MDDGFDDHPKVVAMLDRDDPTEAGVAIGLWSLAFSWANRNTRKRGKIPGLIPAGLPRRWFGAAGRPAAELLVEYGLWEAHESGGWLFHDFDDYLPTEKTREARSEAGKRGAAKRWAGRKSTSGDGVSNDADGGTTASTDTQDVQDDPNFDGNLPSVCHDVDSNPMANDGSRAPARRAISKEIAPIPNPTPTPVPPSAVPADAGTPDGLFNQPSTPTDLPAAAALTVTQRSKRITDAYAEAEPMCKWPAVNGIVLKAIKSGRYTDDDIRDGLLRLAKEGRTVTVETLRIELAGLVPPNSQGHRGGGYQPSYPSRGVAVRDEQPRMSAGERKWRQANELAEQLDREFAANGGVL